MTTATDLGTTVAKTGLKAAPIIGIAAGLYSAKQNFEQGNYLEAGLDLIGIIPIIGDAVDLGRLVVEAGKVVPYAGIAGHATLLGTAGGLRGRLRSAYHSNLELQGRARAEALGRNR